MTLRTLSRACWGLVVSSALVASCRGSAFHTSDEEPPAAAGTRGEAGQGGAAEGGGGALSAGAGSLLGGGAGDAGSFGGGGAPSDCARLLGQELNQHCYIDVTTESVTQARAVEACASLAVVDGREAHLLVLDTPAEQTFILNRFLRDFTDESDAWLGLACTAAEHPEVGDCYCTACTAEELLKKQEAWSWLDGTRATFGWVNNNPNAASRCAALAYNPEVMVWGWVERQCDQAMVTPIAGHPHTYRTICELEP